MKRELLLHATAAITPPTTAKTGKYMMVTELAELLDAHPNTIYRMIKKPGFPALRIGGLVRIPRAAVMDYLAKHTTGAACDN